MRTDSSLIVVAYLSSYQLYLHIHLLTQITLFPSDLMSAIIRVGVQIVPHLAFSF